MKYIFVVGCAKTGSKLVRSILMTNPRVNILDELHLLEPWWLKQDFARLARKIGPLSDDGNIEKLVELMFSGRLHGAFWQGRNSNDKVAIHGRISDLDPDLLARSIHDSERSLATVTRILIDEHTRFVGREIGGAKFPVNIAFVPTLVEWFPGCRIVHLIRDPRAIYASMVKMTLKWSTLEYPLKKHAIQLGRFAYICHQYRNAVSVHNTYKSGDNYFCLKFEDLVRSPGDQVGRLCDFLNIEYLDNMLSPPTGVGSNYESRATREQGFDAKTLDRWKDNIPLLARKAIETVLRREMREMGYA